MTARVEQVIAGRRLEAVARPGLDTDERAVREPALVAQRRERGRGETGAIGRIEEGEGRGLGRGARPCRVAQDEARRVDLARAADIALGQRQRGRVVVDEDAARGAARQRLQPQRAGAAEQVEDARVAQRRGRTDAKRCSSTSNSACRTRSAVGRMRASVGASSARPRCRPATIRMRVAVSAESAPCRIRRRPCRAAPSAALPRSRRGSVGRAGRRRRQRG